MQEEIRRLADSQKARQHPLHDCVLFCLLLTARDCSPILQYAEGPLTMLHQINLSHCPTWKQMSSTLHLCVWQIARISIHDLNGQMKCILWDQNHSSACLSASAMQRVPFKVQFSRLFILQQFYLRPNWLFSRLKLYCRPRGKEHKQLRNSQPLNNIALTEGDSLNIAAYNVFSP